jgi:hypothetical protein
MTDVIKVLEQDIIFLSYDEPNAEKNYVDLLNKAPWAKRVHGVKGSDAAHKACAALSETEYFVTVDADNIIDPKFLEIEIDLAKYGYSSDNVFSWCGKNHINNLMYGNGGLKLWTRKFVNEMRTHENSNPADEKSKVEFCFDSRYIQFDECFSESFINASPFQAWRAGFREGVKMNLNQGTPSPVDKIWWQNYHRLLVWCNIGSDVSNGVWSMLGAREGCYLTNLTEWDYTNVRDFDYLTSYWIEKHEKNDNPEQYYEWLGKELRRDLKMEVADLNKDASLFFKSVYQNFPRTRRK